MMNIHLMRSCVTIAVAISLLPVSVQATGAVGSKCYAAPIAGLSSNEPFAKLDVNTFRKCVSIGERLNVLALKPGSPFASTCAAEISNLKVHTTDCHEVPDALKHDDLVRVDDVGGQLWLSIWRGMRVIVHAPLTATMATIDSDPAPYTIGYHTDVPFGTPPASVRYDVYLQYLAKVENGQRVLSKYYAVEVFENKPACRAELPEAMKLMAMACDQIRVGEGDGEAPAGGGGEPPPQ